MTIPRLTVIPAGAGSGKTHRIQTQLADWVISGLVSPGRILAVTFTEAAASELKERIRFELVKRDRIEDALKLEEAYISTIHGFGLRVLTEFAFEGGYSPSPRQLNEDEQGFLIRRTLPKTDKAEVIAINLRKFGYLFDPVSKEGPEKVFIRKLLSLIGRLRSLGRKGEDPALIAGAVELLRRFYGATEKADVLNRRLHDSVSSLLKRFPGDLSCSYEGNKSAVKTFKENFRALRKAEKIDELAIDWELWLDLQDLRCSKRGAPTPPGYDDLASDVMSAAKALYRHPGPLKDAELHVGALLGASQDCLGAYAEEKRNEHLVDFSDMLADSHEILSTRPDVLEILKNRVDCLVIDEFQDTNPLQFSLLWKIRDAGVPALIVGDVKQSIMGFQNADPRLFEQLEKQNPEALEPLTGNWRASAPLMEWVNAVGEGLFGGAYTRLTPKADFRSTLDPLEVVDAPNFIRGNLARASWTAVRIKSLLEDESGRIWDKVEKSSRSLRGGDIAVLCPTHELVGTYAKALGALGIRTRIKQDEWYASSVVQIICHALAYLADAGDRHAALYLAVTDLGSHSLESALGALRRGEQLEEPVLDLLEPLRTGAAEKTMEVMVSEVIDALDLYGEVSLWPEAAQARANILRFEAEALEFRKANRRVLLAGGYYGNGIKTFLSWLSARVEENDAQPEPRVVDEDAVTISTWHSAKGLEWPIVAVCGMHRKIESRLPNVSVNYDDFDDLGNILRKARVEIVPGFEAKETTAAFQAHLQSALEEEARRLLYVAVTRAREKVILEWPSHLAGKDKTYPWSLLVGAAGMVLEKDEMRVNGKAFPCVVNPAETYLAPSVAASEGEPIAPLSTIGRRAIAYRPVPGNLTPETVTPSLLHGEPGETSLAGLLREETYGLPLETALDVVGADRGLLLHKCFEVLGGRPGRVDLLERATGVTIDKKMRGRLESAVADFERWLAGRFQPLRVVREVPLLGLDVRGSVVSGVLDLLVETAGGYWILDHKSDVTDDRAARFEAYLPQLRCYADLIRKAFPGKPVLGVAIHWISYGKVNLLPGEGSA
jgi:ATP-dependent exoDNAse (exonuclease V) beta subunit